MTQQFQDVFINIFVHNSEKMTTMFEVFNENLKLLSNRESVKNSELYEFKCGFQSRYEYHTVPSEQQILGAGFDMEAGLLYICRRLQSGAPANWLEASLVLVILEDAVFRQCPNSLMELEQASFPLKHRSMPFATILPYRKSYKRNDHTLCGTDTASFISFYRLKHF